MRILVDMDGVIADFEKGALKGYAKENPKNPLPQRNGKNSFYLENDFEKPFSSLIREVYNLEGFFQNLEPVEGSLEALTTMATNQEVFICTSPLLTNPSCAQEKLSWVETYLGAEWLKRTIITKDKTIIDGDILIDDKPKIKGAQEPRWEHVLYSQPYNESVNEKRRLTWENWQRILRL